MSAINTAGLATGNVQEHETLISTPPSADYACQGISEEYMKSVNKRLDDQQREIENFKDELKRQREEYEKEIGKLNTELKKVIEENGSLKKELKDLKEKSTSDQARLVELEEISKKYDDVLKEHKSMKSTIGKLTKANQQLEEDLQRAGVKKKNWWKVVALAFIGGITCAGIGAGIAAFFVCAPAIATVAGIAGVCGAITGGALGYKFN